MKEAIAKRRAERGLAAPDEAEPQIPEASKPVSLEISIASKGETWELPWMCFNGACFSANAATPDGSGKAERLDIFYVQREVIIFGKNLLVLRKAVNAMMLSEIRETPNTYSDAAWDDSQPMIISITIKLREKRWFFTSLSS
ncbi:hypothetical protein OH491_16475 [Termitidicoccus mucosus]|uniref:hypothetical protein n=1 Tax=Termitidicoccus mucosus TaxID=1184151 RepID=UPI002FEE01AC